MPKKVFFKDLTISVNPRYVRIHYSNSLWIEHTIKLIMLFCVDMKFLITEFIWVKLLPIRFWIWKTMFQIAICTCATYELPLNKCENKHCWCYNCTEYLYVQGKWLKTSINQNMWYVTCIAHSHTSILQTLAIQ